MKFRLLLRLTLSLLVLLQDDHVRYLMHPMGYVSGVPFTEFVHFENLVTVVGGYV
jgi:hypothetical protein